MTETLVAALWQVIAGGIAAFGWLSLAAQSPNAETQGKQSQTRQTVDRGAPAIPTNATTPIEKIERPKKQEPCGPNQYESRDDLCAQWKAADATSNAAWYTAASFWLGMAGTLGLLATLYYTRKAVLAAEEATRDADAALDIVHVRHGEVYPVFAVGAMYQWAGGSSETLMSYLLLDRASQNMGFPAGDWEIPAERIEIRRDGVHSIT